MKLPLPVLLLDDDPRVLVAMAELCREFGLLPIPCETVIAAQNALEQKPVFAVVDLYLAGNSGAELSNNFIRDQLVPKRIAFGRLTSAPDEVPREFSGEWVLHKRLLLHDRQQVVDAIRESLDQQGRSI